MVMGCASVAAVTGVARAQAPRFEVKVLQTEGQCFRAEATGLDDDGRAVGYSYGLCGAPPAGRIWTVGGPEGGTVLATLPDSVNSCGPDARDNAAMAWDIRNGHIAGNAATYDCEDPFNFKPMVWENGAPRLLPMPSGWTLGEAHAINKNGDALGRMYEGDQPERIGFWPVDGAPQAIGPTNGHAYDLNGNRQVVGCDESGSPPSKPFVWQNGQTTTLEPSSWTNQQGCAYAINESGVIAGVSDNRPVYWQNGSLKRIAPAQLIGATVDVNDAGRMIGFIGGQAFYADGTNVWDLASLVDDQASLAPGLDSVIKLNNANQVLASRQHQPWNDAPFPDIVLLVPKVPSGSAPAVTMTSPWNGQPLTDMVTLTANASDSSGIAGVTFYQFGQALGPEDTSAPYAVDVDLFGTGPIYFHALARDGAGNLTSTPLRFATVTNGCQDVVTAQTINGSIGAQTGQFTLRFTGLPQAAPMEGGFALAQGTPGGFSGTAAAVLFAPDGTILVRNGAAYQATGVSYAAGVSHHFRMAVDVAAQRYSVWLKLANQPERQLAAGAAFRTTVSQLDHWIGRVDDTSPGSPLTVCNVRMP
jgi:hypothetical protein